MASRSLVLMFVLMVSLVIVSQGVLAARELAEKTKVDVDGMNVDLPEGCKGAVAVSGYGGGWSGSYGGRHYP
uniref:Uncharacterized protein n=1 Tax=Oryza barthii TaxID=65489 RepID=A0A0D3GFV0_9ORYZ